MDELKLTLTEEELDQLDLQEAAMLYVVILGSGQGYPLFDFFTDKFGMIAFTRETHSFLDLYYALKDDDYAQR